MISSSNKYNFLITQCFIKPVAISSQAVVSLQEETVYKNGYVVIVWGLD